MKPEQERMTAEQARKLLAKTKTHSKQRIKADKRKKLTDIADKGRSTLKTAKKLLKIEFNVGPCTVVHYCLPENAELVKKYYQ